MLREEAIRLLSGLMFKGKLKEALDMAIKALEQEPTTKNDLGVSSELEKNSKKLEKDFGELDCISRAQTQTEIEMNASRYTIAKDRGGMGQVEWSDQLIKVSDAVNIIRHLPSVTPQVPKCKNCKWWKDSDGEYRRGCRAESKCGINTDKVYQGEGYCYMFEPQERSE